MKYYIGWVNGVGKWSIISSLLDYPNTFHYQGSSILMKKLWLPEGDYKNLRALERKYKDDMFEEAIWEILTGIEQSADPKAMHLFDAHYLNLVEWNIFNACNQQIISNMDCLVLVTADTKEVLTRIQKDVFRDRKLFTTQEFDPDIYTHYINQTTLTAKQLAQAYNKSFLEIRNPEWGLNQAVEQLMMYHKSQIK